MSALAVTSRYAAASAVDPSRLSLVADQAGEAPPFFVGALTDPARFAALLLALGEVVQARHHLPAAMLSRVLAEADPVVTVGDGAVRFEGFSACCSAYARVDLLPEGVASTTVRHGTTNIDFSAALRAALIGLRFAPGAALSVSADAVALASGDAVVIERKIALPLRWVRGFSNVGAMSRRLVQVGELSAAEARRALLTLPRDAQAGAPTWLVPSGRSVRLSTRAAPGAVRLSGPSRVRALEAPLRAAERLTLYADPEDQCGAFVVHSGAARLTLVVSADPWRGFSGEGQGLAEAAAPPAGLAAARAALRWQAGVDPAALGPDADAVLLSLGAHGLVGFDAVTGRWFHRELPWRPERLEVLLPRLRAARALAAEPDAVRFDGDAVAWVRGSEGMDRVDLSAATPRCSCAWHAKTGGAQGPCRHALAAVLRVGA